MRPPRRYSPRGVSGTPALGGLRSFNNRILNVRCPPEAAARCEREGSLAWPGSEMALNAVPDSDMGGPPKYGFKRQAGQECGMQRLGLFTRVIWAN